MEVRPNKISARKLTLIILVIFVFGFCVLFFVGEGSMRKKLYDLKVKSLSSTSEIKRLERDVVKMESRIKGEISDIKSERASNEENRLDLVAGKFQRMNEIFSVLFVEIKPHLTGLKARGEILNQSSVVHKDIKLRVEISGQAEEVVVSGELKPGYAKDFEFYLPDISLGDAKFVKMDFIESTMEYYK